MNTLEAKGRKSFQKRERSHRLLYHWEKRKKKNGKKGTLDFVKEDKIYYLYKERQ